MFCCSCLILVAFLIIFISFAGRNATFLTQLMIGSLIGALVALMRFTIPRLLFDYFHCRFGIESRFYIAFMIEFCSEAWYSPNTSVPSSIIKLIFATFPTGCSSPFLSLETLPFLCWFVSLRPHRSSSAVCGVSLNIAIGWDQERFEANQAIKSLRHSSSYTP